MTEALSQMRIEGQAYNRCFDTDSAHSGNWSGPLDTEVTTDPNGGQCNIGWTAVGEWLEYDVNVVQTGHYDLVFRR